MKAPRAPIFAMSILLLGCLLTGCTSVQRSEEQQLSENVRPFLAPYHGQVLLLLMGREGCPGTAKATKVLDAYASRKADAVAILRLYVPLPGENLQVAEKWVYPYPREVDADRKIADALDFFFYPTFYVFDPDGEMRYSGGCDASKVDQMVKEILAEKPGQAKTSYNLPMPKAGEPAPAFEGTNLNGQAVVTLANLKGKNATLLVFAQTGCPFTIDALPGIQGIADCFRKHDVAVVVINTGEDEKKIRPIYAKYLPNIPVIWDKGGEISKIYGVDMTPFFFLLEQTGKTVKRRSFTSQAATGALNALLGLGFEVPRYPLNEAG